MNNKPENVYYDIQVNNFESTGTQSQPMRFRESRIAPLVTEANKYEVSIVRFEVDTYSLPTWIASIEPEQNDPNKMIESITLEFKSSVSQQYLTFIPTNKHISVPPAPSPIQPNDEYYYANSFRHYCDLVNNALELATQSLKTSNAVLLSNLVSPKLIWNSDNDTCSIIAQDQYFNNKLNEHVKIYFNRALYGKLTSLPADKNYNGTFGKIYKINMNDDYTTKHISLDIGSGLETFIKVDQEFSTIANWAAVSSIVFTTNSLPIIATQQSEPLTYSNGLALSTGSVQNSNLIISDMATNELCYKPNLMYVPSAEYRMISLIGNSEIRDIDISVYWKDKKGNLNPFYLQSGASCSIKLYFRLK